MGEARAFYQAMLFVLQHTAEPSYLWPLSATSRDSERHTEHFCWKYSFLLEQTQLGRTALNQGHQHLSHIHRMTKSTAGVFITCHLTQTQGSVSQSRRSCGINTDSRNSYHCYLPFFFPFLLCPASPQFSQDKHLQSHAANQTSGFIRVKNREHQFNQDLFNSNCGFRTHK